MKSTPKYFMETILPDEAVGLHYARLSITPNSLFDEMYMTNFKTLDVENELYPTDEEYEELTTLQNEKNVRRNKLLFGLSRKFDWGKS